MHFLKRFLHWLFKNNKIITVGATDKGYSGLSPKFVTTQVSSLEPFVHLWRSRSSPIISSKSKDHLIFSKVSSNLVCGINIAVEFDSTDTFHMVHSLKDI